MQRTLTVLWLALMFCLAAGAAELPAKSDSLPVANQGDAGSSNNWYRESLRKIHFDMHTPGNVTNIARDFDADKFALEIKDAGFDAVSYFAKCGFGWSYYPTKIGVMHPGLNFDLFGKGVDALRKQNLKIIAYYNLARAPEAVVQQHPDWRFITNGIPAKQREYGGVPCCLFTPYLEEHVIPQLEEIAGSYKVDGVFLDSLPAMAGTDCDCAVCRAARKAAGFENAAAAEPLKYYEWRLERTQKRCELILDSLHQKYPDFRVGINYMSACRHGLSFPVPKNTGYLTGDMVNPGDVYLYSNYELACWCWRDTPADCMQMRMVINWKEWTIRSQEARYSEAALAIARGSTYFIGDLLQPHTLALDEEIMSMHKQVNDFIGQRESLHHAARPFAEVAVLHDSFVGETQPEKQEYGLGAFTALMDDGQTTQVLHDYDLSASLADYHTLVISHCPLLNDEAMSALEKFVQNGGNLVLCGRLPPENQPAFARILGVSFAQTNTIDTPFVFLKNTPLAEGLKRRIHAVPPIICQTNVSRVAPAQAGVICYLTDSSLVPINGLRPPGKLTDAIGVSLNHFGRGKAIYTPMPLAHEYWQHGNLQAKYLLQVMVRFVQPPPLVEVESEADVNLFTTRRGSEILAHVISRSGESRPNPPRLEEHQATIHDVKMKFRLPNPPRSIRLVPGDTALTWTKTDDSYQVELPPFKTHACCVIREGE